MLSGVKPAGVAPARRWPNRPTGQQASCLGSGRAGVHSFWCRAGSVSPAVHAAGASASPLHDGKTLGRPTCLMLRWQEGRCAFVPVQGRHSVPSCVRCRALLAGLLARSGGPPHDGNRHAGEVPGALADLLRDLLQVEQGAPAAGAAHVLGLRVAHAAALHKCSVRAPAGGAARHAWARLGWAPARICACVGSGGKAAAAWWLDVFGRRPDGVSLVPVQGRQVGLECGS